MNHTMYGFKPVAKTQVLIRLQKLYGKNKKFVVNGKRLTHTESMHANVPANSYFVDAYVDGVCVAAVYHCDWRQAYKNLVSEVQRTYDSKIGVLLDQDRV